MLSLRLYESRSGVLLSQQDVIDDDVLSMVDTVAPAVETLLAPSLRAARLSRAKAGLDPDGDLAGNVWECAGMRHARPSGTPRPSSRGGGVGGLMLVVGWRLAGVDRRCRSPGVPRTGLGLGLALELADELGT